MRLATTCILTSLAVACADNEHRVQPDAGVAPGCNPIVGDDCLTPFPSSFHTVADPTSATGVRVALRSDELPVSRQGVMLDATRFDRRDGFSPSSSFFVYFKAGVDLAELPDQSNEGLAASILPTSPVQIIDAETGDRVPLFAELDANAQPWDEQALIIRPMVRLKGSTRYLIALVGLHDQSGNPLAPGPFVRLRDSLPLDAAEAPLAPLYDDIFTRLATYGVARSSLSLAWDVMIGSDEQERSHLTSMTAAIDPPSLGYTITGATDDATSPDRLREVLATIQVPWFLDDAGKFMASSTGTQNGVRDVAITIEIPRCALGASKPIPYLVFGHGLFLDAKGQLEDPFFLWMANQLCMVAIGTDWIGLAADDVANLTSLATDMNNVFTITDRLQQAHVDFQAMTKLFATKIAADPALEGLVDGAQGYYFGISDGSIQGATYLSLSSEIARGALDVPGGDWTLMLFRSTDFTPILSLLQLVYPQALDRQILIALTQLEWDYTDPITFAPGLLAGKQVVLEESIGDAQVTNLSTRLLARTIGLDALPLVQPVYGISEKSGPLPSAYTQWDSHPATLPPTTNMPASMDNGAHEAILGDARLLQQMKLFLTPGGQVTDTCGGACQ